MCCRIDILILTRENVASSVRTLEDDGRIRTTVILPQCGNLCSQFPIITISSWLSKAETQHARPSPGEDGGGVDSCVTSLFVLVRIVLSCLILGRWEIESQ